MSVAKRQRGYTRAFRWQASGGHGMPCLYVLTNSPLRISASSSMGW